MIYQNYINGKWIPSKSGKTFKNINPADPNQILGKFQSSSEDDVNKAVQAAEQAFESWNDLPAAKRGDILYRTAHLLKENKERLARILTLEMGKVLKEAEGDVQEAIDITEYMAGEGRRLLGHTTPSELKDKFCLTIRMPVGVFGLITPWNFPTAIPAWKLMPALICGNTVVFKPASDTPQSAIELVKILNKAGVPKGVLNLVTGNGHDVGRPIIKHDQIKGISFTGSKDVGNYVIQNAGLKKVGLELGGKNAIIIMDDADLKLALEGVIWGAFGTTGQRCTAASRIIIHKKVKDKFERMLVSATKKLRLGPGIKNSTDIGPLINEKAVEKVHHYTEMGIHEGAKLLTGGKIPKMKGFYYEPTVFTDVNWNMKIAQDEIFGPSAAIIPVKNIDEAIHICNSTAYGLSSAIYTKSLRNAFLAVEKIQTGITYVNSSTIGSEIHLPFGGVKATGHGREAGILGIDEFSESKTIYFDFSGKLQKAQGIK